MSKKEKKARFGISMDAGLLREVDKARGLAKRSTFIEWQVSKAFQLDKIRDDLYGICDDLLNEILLVDNLPIEVRSLDSIQVMISEARKRVEKIRKIIKATT